MERGGGGGGAGLGGGVLGGGAGGGGVVVEIGDLEPSGMRGEGVGERGLR